MFKTEIKEINLTRNELTSIVWGSWGIGFIDENGNQLSTCSSCRTWLDDFIWGEHTNKLNLDSKHLQKTVPYVKDKYVFLLKLNSKKEIKYIEKNLPSLNTLFAKYDIGEVDVYQTQDELFFVVEGDKIWHSEVWKSSLFTNYIKTLFMVDEYTTLRDSNEHMLLTLVTRDNGEILQPIGGSIHSDSGFVSLLQGYNLNTNIIKNFVDEKIIKPYKEPFGLSEIFQSLDIKFSFINKDLEEITAPAKCRDFLCDVVYSRLENTPVQVYGFKYDFAKNPYDVDTLRLKVTFPSKLSKVTFTKNIKKLHDDERSAKVGQLTKVFDIKNDNLSILIEADKIWQETPWKLSLYSFYIKRYSYKDDKSLKEPENKYIKHLTKDDNESILLSRITDGVIQKFTGTYIHNIHDTNGFIHYITNILKKAA